MKTIVCTALWMLPFSLIAQTPSTGETIAGALGGVMVIILAILAFVLSILWIIFPFFVYGFLRDIRDESRRTRAAVEAMNAKVDSTRNQ